MPGYARRTQIKNANARRDITHLTRISLAESTSSHRGRFHRESPIRPVRLVRQSYGARRARDIAINRAPVISGGARLAHRSTG